MLPAAPRLSNSSLKRSRRVDDDFHAVLGMLPAGLKCLAEAAEAMHQLIDTRYKAYTLLRSSDMEMINFLMDLYRSGALGEQWQGVCATLSAMMAAIPVKSSG